MFKQGFLRDGSETALNSYVKRMTVKLNNGIGVDEVQWLNEHLAYKVLEALKNWHRRLMQDAIKKAGRIPPVNERTGKPAGYEQTCAAFDLLT
jgi:phage gp16-like protein